MTHDLRVITCEVMAKHQDVNHDLRSSVQWSTTQRCYFDCRFWRRSMRAVVVAQSQCDLDTRACWVSRETQGDRDFCNVRLDRDFWRPFQRKDRCCFMRDVDPYLRCFAFHTAYHSFLIHECCVCSSRKLKFTQRVVVSDCFFALRHHKLISDKACDKGASSSILFISSKRGATRKGVRHYITI